MRTQTQQASYAEALSVLVDLEREIAGSCFTARLSGSNGIWKVDLMAWEGPLVNTLIRVLNLQRDSTYDLEDENGGQRGMRGRRGRTLVELSVCYTKVKRTNGITGLPEGSPGLW